VSETHEGVDGCAIAGPAEAAEEEVMARRDDEEDAVGGWADVIGESQHLGGGEGPLPTRVSQGTGPSVTVW
jgi:hypothetical protein